MFRFIGLLAGAFLAFVFFAGSAQAQSALCPASIPGQTGIAFESSSCTNNITGAYSNAALGSQSLGELAQSSTEDATKTTMASVSDRREAESQACPAGFTRVNGTCTPVPPASRFAPETPGSFSGTVPAALLAFAPQSTKSAPWQPVAEPPHLAAWMKAYGDYERRTGQSPGLGEFSVLALNVTSTTRSGGVLTGVDYTFRNIMSAGDGLIVGLLVGYESSHVSLSASSISSDPTSPNGFSTTKARLSGAATGVYASYFNGGFSTDLAFKVEFYDLNLSVTDLLGFQSNPDVGFPPTSIPFSGGGTTRLNNYTTSVNVNYRIPVSANVWVEPTGGLQYTYSAYASGADQLGLASGSLLRLQGGERLGFEGSWNGTRMTTTLTGLLYDDVLVTGGVLATSPNPLILSDEGKLRAEGIVTLNFYHSNHVSSFVQADLQGGEGLFGVGAKGGVRVAW